MNYRIAITGPESTGKSTLAAQLAHYFKAVKVDEFSRIFLEKQGGTYTYPDILEIAKAQFQLNIIAKPENGFVFFDTELLVTYVWCLFKYKKVHPWIEENIQNQGIDLFLLTKPDLPWQPDPLREHPDKLNELFQLYRQSLNKFNLPFEVIGGLGPDRLKNAVEAVQKRLISK